MRRLTPSPTELAENQTYLIGLRPRDLRDRILESLRLNELSLVVQTPAGEALDFQILQRLISENSRIKDELVRLSLASYNARNLENGGSRTLEAETLLNFIFSRLSSQEILSFQELLKTNIIDDTVIGNVINLIRLTGINDPLVFISVLENTLQGTLNLRHFLGTIDLSTQTSLLGLEDLKVREVDKDLLEAINQKESQGLMELEEKASNIETTRLERVDQIVQNANLQRVLMNTGITFGVSGLIWASYRWGVWDSLFSNVISHRPQPMSETETGFFENMKMFMAGTTGFLLKKGLFRR